MLYDIGSASFSDARITTCKSSPQRPTHIFWFCSHLISLFLKKIQTEEFQIFLTFFDKRKSCKKCKETLNPTSERLILALQSCHIPCCGVSVSSFCVPLWSISSSGYAHIEV